jgi:hypothetical protein
MHGVRVSRSAKKPRLPAATRAYIRVAFSPKNFLDVGFLPPVFGR